jgi:diacylglycerol kinase (ATP)
MVPMIEARLTKEKIPFELKPTQKAYDTYHFARDCDISKYSLLVAAGGDGSYHEVVNGMLHRPDGKKLPLAFIPNGSGNNLCRALGYNTLQDALDYIVNAEVILSDTILTFTDYERVEDVPSDP